MTLNKPSRSLLICSCGENNVDNATAVHSTRPWFPVSASACLQEHFLTNVFFDNKNGIKLPEVMFSTYVYRQIMALWTWKPWSMWNVLLWKQHLHILWTYIQLSWWPMSLPQDNDWRGVRTSSFSRSCIACNSQAAQVPIDFRIHLFCIIPTLPPMLCLCTFSMCN